MSQQELKHPVFTMPYPADMEEGETIRDYALRKAAKCEEQREQIAQLKDGIRDIAIQADDSEKVIDSCSTLLSEV